MHTTNRETPRRDARSLAGAALVCALAAAQALASLHFVVVPHTICPEHGESIHGAPADGHDHSEHSTEEASWHLGGPLSQEGHDHDHCSFAVEVRSWLTRAQVPSCVLPAVTAVRGMALPASVTPVSIDLVLLAPKTSPPA